MVRSLGLSLLFAWCFQRCWSQEPLQNQGKDCFFKCWKTPGFCNYCGAGNACCRAGDRDSDPKECQGPLVYDPSVNGQFHECVKSSFLPGQAPPAALQSPGGISKQAKEMCISYMAAHGCSWTNRYSCPGQPKGYKGVAKVDDSIGYKCCCTNGLWRESATIGDAPRPYSGNNVIRKEQCAPYMNKHGCGWTMDYKCPLQPPPYGQKGTASNDGSLGYQCCCLNDLWRETTTTTGQPYVPTANTPMNANARAPIDENAFNVDAEMETLPGASTSLTAPVAAGALILPVATNTGFQVGREVVIGKGTAQQEVNTIVRMGSIVLKYPLKFAHPAGVTIEMPSSMGSQPNGGTPVPGGNGFGIVVAPGEQHGSHVPVPVNPADPNFLHNHKGANIHVTQMKIVDPAFKPTEHHGPIHNKFSNNDDKAKKERCTFGICADLDANNPDLAHLPGTAHGLDISKTPNTGSVNQLPSYVATLQNDNNVHTEEIKNGVANPVINGTTAAPSVAAPTKEIITKTTQGIAAGATSIVVASQAGFAIGDVISIGNGAETKIISGFGSITINSPMKNSYPAGTEIKKIVANPGGTTLPPLRVISGQATGATAAEEETGSSGSSGGYGWLIALILALLCCLIAAAAAAFIMMKKGKPKKTKGAGTDREAYLKNEFVERQPVYHEVPPTEPPLETEPMMKDMEAPPVASMAVDINHDGRPDVIVAGVDMNRDGIPDVLQGNPNASAIVAPLAATPSFPIQVGPPPLVAAYPNTASMTTPMPFGNYVSPSSYMPASTAYSTQLGMTGPLTSLPRYR